MVLEEVKPPLFELSFKVSIKPTDGTFGGCHPDELLSYLAHLRRADPSHEHVSQTFFDLWFVASELFIFHHCKL
jgi:hypothetical protein